VKGKDVRLDAVRIVLTNRVRTVAASQRRLLLRDEPSCADM